VKIRYLPLVEQVATTAKIQNHWDGDFPNVKKEEEVAGNSDKGKLPTRGRIWHTGSSTREESYNLEIAEKDRGKTDSSVMTSPSTLF
jgi:hypothetical protein